jgi:hypothetical protein
MVADQAYVDAINAFSATIAPLTDPDDIAGTLTALDATFAAIRAKARAVANVAVLAADAVAAQAAADQATAAHSEAVALAAAPTPTLAMIDAPAPAEAVTITAADVGPMPAAVLAGG